MVDVRNEVSDVFDDVDLLLDEQPLQDERILTLEQDADELEEKVQGMKLFFLLQLVVL